MAVNVDRLKIVKILTNEHRILRRVHTPYHLDSRNVNKNKHFVVKLANCLAGVHSSIKKFCAGMKRCKKLLVFWSILSDSWMINDRWKTRYFFYLGFLSRTLTIHRTSGEGGSYLFNSSLPLSLASQTLTQPVITEESLSLHITSSQTRTVNLWFPSSSH